METLCFTNSQEGSDTTVSWEDHGNGVLEFGGSLHVNYMPHETVTGGVLCCGAA